MRLENHVNVVAPEVHRVKFLNETRRACAY